MYELQASEVFCERILVVGSFNKNIEARMSNPYHEAFHSKSKAEVAYVVVNQKSGQSA